MLRRIAMIVLALPFLARGPALGAQTRTALMPQWEGRGDVTLAPAAGAHWGAHAGAGVNVRAGHYVRLGVALSLGAVESAVARDDPVTSARAGATARFLLDPFAERRTGLYGGAGFTARRDGGSAWRGNLLLVLGIEGPARGRVVPALEVALGGGVRVGMVIRSRRDGGRR